VRLGVTLGVRVGVNVDVGVAVHAVAVRVARCSGEGPQAATDKIKAGNTRIRFDIIVERQALEQKA
jgi:hypothetical protein